VGQLVKRKYIFLQNEPALIVNQRDPTFSPH